MSDNILRIDDSKAGMAAIRKDAVESVINDISKGSQFFENEKRLRDQRDEKIRKMKLQLDAHSSTILRLPEVSRMCSVGQEVLRKVRLAESEILAVTAVDRVVHGHSLPKHIGIFVHIDIDMFFAAVEEKEQPALSNLPMAVGGMSMLSTSNYKARSFGVRAGMPGFIAKELCPDLVILPPRYEKYKISSDIFKSAISRYDDDYISGGMDEASLDILPLVLNEDNDYFRDFERLVSHSQEIVSKIRSEVFLETGLTCSAGIAPTRALAKIASNKYKPNGQFSHKMGLGSFTSLSTFVEEIQKSVSTFPLRETPQIGKVTSYILSAFDIHSLNDIFKKKYILAFLFPEKTFSFLYAASVGLSGTYSGSHAEPRTVGRERTFASTASIATLSEIATHLCKDIAKEVKSQRLAIRAVTLKLKCVSFAITQHTVTFDFVENFELSLISCACKLVSQYGKDQYRLLGIRAHVEKRHAGNTVTLNDLWREDSCVQFIGEKRPRDSTVIVIDD